MAHDRPTMLDVVKTHNTDEVAGLIDEATLAWPEFGIGFARPVSGINYRTLVRTDLPAAGFRAANEGIEVKKGVYINRLVECFILDASWDADKAVADAAEDGAGPFCTLMANDHMEAAIKSVCQQFYYGTASGVSGAANGFQGLVDYVDAAMVVDAAGTGATTSSVYAVKFGPKDTAFVLGNGGRIEDGDILVQQKSDTDSKVYMAYVQPIQGWIGLQVGSKYSVGRIRNVDASAAGKTLDDDMLAELLSDFPTGRRPDYLLMTRRSLEQLRKSRTATNATGAPAPTPTDAFGVPIVATDALTDTETAS